MSNGTIINLVPGFCVAVDAYDVEEIATFLFNILDFSNPSLENILVNIGKEHPDVLLKLLELNRKYKPLIKPSQVFRQKIK